jgi:carbamate kinase
VDRVAVGWGTPAQRFLDRLSVAEARRLLAAGEFPPGSMGPKVEAAVQFVEGGGQMAVITSLDRLADAAAGTAGTMIVQETK